MTYLDDRIIHIHNSNFIWPHIGVLTPDSSSPRSQRPPGSDGVLYLHREPSARQAGPGRHQPAAHQVSQDHGRVLHPAVVPASSSSRL